MKNILATKKGNVMQEVVSIFLIILVVVVIVGMIFTFTSSFKTQVANTGGGAFANNTAYKAVNDTEAAGATVVSYLPMIILALILGIVLFVIFKVVTPLMGNKEMDL